MDFQKSGKKWKNKIKLMKYPFWQKKSKYMIAPKTEIFKHTPREIIQVTILQIRQNNLRYKQTYSVPSSDIGHSFPWSYLLRVTLLWLRLNIFSRHTALWQGPLWTSITKPLDVKCKDDPYHIKLNSIQNNKGMLRGLGILKRIGLT